MTPEQNLMKLGLALPTLASPVGSYVGFIRLDDLVLTSGQLPMREGKLAVAGKVGGDVTLDQAVEGARIAALNAVAQVVAAAKGMDHIVHIVRLGVFVNSAPGFTDQAKVANGASDLLVGIFGDAGRHVRTSVGVSELPLNAAVEVELAAQVRG